MTLYGFRYTIAYNKKQCKNVKLCFELLKNGYLYRVSNETHIEQYYAAHSH